jgi:phage repressor protein C with HTH and peptisase S24 domain
LAKNDDNGTVLESRREVGKRITAFYESKGLKRPAFAQSLEIPYDRQLSYEQGRAEPGSTYWRKVKQVYPDADIGHLMTGIEGFKETEIISVNQMIPVVSEVHAGSLRLGFSDEEILEWIPFIQMPDKEVFAVRVKGDSMSPEIKDGDYAICAPQRTFISGEIYLVVNDGSEHTIKRVFRQKDGYYLVPTNPDYPPALLHEAEVTKLVRVIYHVGKH